MRLDEFTYIPPEAREKTARFLMHLIGDPTADPAALLARVEANFIQCYNENQIIYVNGDQPVPEEEANAALFRTEFMTPTGEEIFGKCTVNKRPGGRHRWFGLFFQPARREGFTIGDLYFRSWNDGIHFLEEVADLAIPEKWSYASYESRHPYPILKSYLEKTFERLQEQGRLVRVENQVLFNTGLINQWFKEIYIVCDVDPENPNRYVNAHPVLENDRVVLETFGNVKPPMATFFSNITDVIFDPDLEINTDDAHIIDDNFDRIPPEYRQMRKSQIFALFQSAIEFARIMARRNYKLVVPQYFNGRIQFLMPIYLSGEFSGSPDCALALEKIGNCYRGNTILTLDMAYQNARLIAKPDSTWLNPDCGKSRQ